MRKLSGCLFVAIFFFSMIGVSKGELLEETFLSVGDGLITKDTETGLEWLDLPVTVGIPPHEIIDGYGGYTTTHGFRYATYSELKSLYENAGIVRFGQWSVDNVPGAYLLLNLMGKTVTNDFSNLPGNWHALGWLGDTWHSYRYYGDVGLLATYRSGIATISKTQPTSAIRPCSYLVRESVDLNNPPTVSAGANLTISSEEIDMTIIQGTATDTDPGDALEYQWREGDVIILDWNYVGENGECPLDPENIPTDIGTHTLILEVTDGQATSSDDMILTIDNSAPNAAISGGCGFSEINTDVTLSGNASDFDADTLNYEWKDGELLLEFGTFQTSPGGAPVDVPPYIATNFNLGEHTIILQVDDGINEPVSSECTLIIKDDTNPTLKPVANKNILWPPNHKMADIVIEANANDNSGEPVILTAQVSSNEPEDGLDGGDIALDWTEPVIHQDAGTITLELRSERSDNEGGRVYTIAITATDESNNSSTAYVNILVPHDKSKKK